MTRWQRWKAFWFREWLRELISPGDTAHELALGTSIGVFVGFTPLFGLHMVIILLVAFVLQRLVRFNKALAVAASYLNNPLTFAPMLWASYAVGAWFVPSASEAFGQGPQIQAFDWHAGIQAVPQYLYGIGLPMLVGCLVLGVVMAAAVYPVTYGCVLWYRRGQPAASLVQGSASPSHVLRSSTLPSGVLTKSVADGGAGEQLGRGSVRDDRTTAPPDFVILEQA